MKYALLFRDNEEPVLVYAEDVKAGRYDRYNEYVDPEYEFKVEYVKSAKHGGGPYFRLYYSYEDYKRLYPERADRYQLVANMRRYEESEWHTRWKTNVSGFCHIEWTIPNKETQRWKIADAYYADMKTCIEFQHSYISFHFEEKNEFYRALSLQAVWLYDLSSSNIKTCADGSLEILEDNARGFFRISENVDNLRDNFVYIQMKSGKIYRVTELGRRETSQSLKSTIRYFWPSEIYEEQEFVTAIQNNRLKSYEDILSDRAKAERQRQEAERLRQEQETAKRKQREAENKALEEAIRQRENIISDFSIPEASRLLRVKQLQDENEQAIRDQTRVAELVEQEKQQLAEQRQKGFYFNKLCPQCGKPLKKKPGKKGTNWLCTNLPCNFYAFENHETGELIMRDVFYTHV